jgi:hypothetical protein
MAQMRSVFGAPANTPLHNFNRGGPWVPNVPANANVPTSGQIRLAQLAGATNYVPVSVSGPATLHMAAFVSTVSGTYTGSGGQGTLTATWTKNSNTGAAININDTHSFSPVFSRALNNTEGDSFWNLAVTDGISTANMTVEVYGASSN